MTCLIDAASPFIRHSATAEAIMSMPEYAAEKLQRDEGKAELTCSIGENEDAVFNKIVLSMHFEGANCAMMLPPFCLDGQSS